MISSNREDVSTSEMAYLDSIIEKSLNLNTIHFGTSPRKVIQYDKRPNMYGGDGVVYLLQMFADAELVNNRIGAYMILPTSDDSVGFHTHGSRKEQELYIIMEGTAEYLEKNDSESSEKKYTLEKGSITTMRGSGFHGLKNIGDSPLIIFVITTNE
jgi:mannose-6-phosphate isomerase-like protein (cupin superfamily)